MKDRSSAYFPRLLIGVVTPLAALFATGLLAASLKEPPADASVAAAKPVADYSVFLDPPTGFVFIKLPTGWKFVARVDAPDLARLPAHVTTALLPRDDADERCTSSPQCVAQARESCRGEACAPQ